MKSLGGINPICDRSRSKQMPESDQITDIVGAPISELPSYLYLANVTSLMIYLLQQNI